MARSMPMERIRCWMTVNSNTSIMNSVKREKYQYSSRHHSKTVNTCGRGRRARAGGQRGGRGGERPGRHTWKTKKGATACSLKSELYVGMGISRTLVP